MKEKNKNFKQLPIATVGNWVLLSNGKTEGYRQIKEIRIKTEGKETFKILITNLCEIDSRNGNTNRSELIAKDKIKVSL